MQLAMDWRSSARLIVRCDAGMAFDRSSVRKIDEDGKLHVDISNISKATVNEYMGREIPDFEQLGLDPEKLYKLYRDPEELAKGAASFNNLQVLSRHVPVSADDHQPDITIGSTGTDAVFEAPYLKNSLVFWSRDAIDAIESEVQKELSSAYRYRADMTPGKSPEGEAYDGVMRDIIGNHVALVKEGRAGSDVVVGDSAIPNIKETYDMSKLLLTRMGSVAMGAVMIALKPKLAQDAKLDLGPLFQKLTNKNFKAKKPALVDGLKKITTGKLAADASIDDVIKIVDALEGTEVAEGSDTDLDTGEPREDDDTSMDAGGGLQNFLKGKLSEDDYKTVCDMMKPAGARDAETDEEKKKREAEEAKKLAGDVEAQVAEKTKDMVTTKAMDEAIVKATAAVTKNATETFEAREAVQAHPLVGKLPLALDTAVKVYQSALGVLGVEDADKISDLGALKAVFKAKAAPVVTKPVIALDAAGDDDFAKRFPNAARIKVSA